MKHLGHIEFKDNKVIFVYRELPEPDIKNDKYWSDSKVVLTIEKQKKYQQDVKEYEASKRSIEIENAEEPFCGHESCTYLKIGKVKYVIKNNQPCEANVENEIATILKICNIKVK